ncbi:hypothetical protein D3C76_1205910 [compost metagenome]
MPFFLAEQYVGAFAGHHQIAGALLRMADLLAGVAVILEKDPRRKQLLHLVFVDLPDGQHLSAIRITEYNGPAMDLQGLDNVIQEDLL